MSKPLIDKKRVRYLYKMCQITPTFTPTDVKIVKSRIGRDITFSTSMVMGNANEITNLLRCFNISFYEEGGAQYQTMIEDESHEMWGTYYDVDKLICLGLAINALRYAAPRKLWKYFPDGFPYIEITTEPFSSAINERDQYVA